MNLYITRPGRLCRKDNTLRYVVFDTPPEVVKHVEDEGAPLAEDHAVVGKYDLPIETIEAVYLFTETQLNTRLLRFLARRKIPVHIFDFHGRHTGVFMPHPEQLSGNLVIRQVEACQNDLRRIHICRALVKAKVHNERSILQYYRRRGHNFDGIEQSICTILQELDQAETPEELMGKEGLATRQYYSAWHHWMDALSGPFRRKYHPPDNPVNALLSFLNALLYASMVSEIYRTALYPGISYLHAPQTRRFSLALDLVEPFKPVLCDRLLFRLFGKKIIGDKDFLPHSNGVLLKDEARKTVLQAWDEQMRVTVRHPQLNRSVSYRQLLRLDCYKLIRFFLEDEPFQPYRMNY